MTAAMILAGEFVTQSKAWGGVVDGPGHPSTRAGRLPRMTGGRCHDHRFFMNEHGPVFEREIFGI
jgi:hypothetical protein